MGRADAPPVDTTFHHIGIQCHDLDNASRWYQDFLGFTVNWTLTEFSSLTRQRLPGIRELRELQRGHMRLHLFDRPGDAVVDLMDPRAQFQHVCLAAASAADIEQLRRIYLDLATSNVYEFAVDEPPTDIVEDEKGVLSFYAYDVNGLELEFTFVPAGGDV